MSVHQSVYNRSRQGSTGSTATNNIISSHDESSIRPTKLRSACETCRKSRVKCNGGHPCSRCTSRGALCDYGVSQKRGRVKADAVPEPAKTPLADTRSRDESTQMPASIDCNQSFEAPPFLPQQSPAVGHLSLNAEHLGVLEMGHSPTAVKFAHGQSQTPIFNQSCESDTAGNFRTSLPSDINSFLSMDFMHSSQPFAIGMPAQCDCLGEQMSVLTSIWKRNEVLLCQPLDEVLHLFKSTSQSIRSQLNCAVCPNCASALMLSTVILQRLVTLACLVTTNSLQYLRGATIKVQVGSFQLDPEQNFKYKKMVFRDAVLRLGEAIQAILSAVSCEIYKDVEDPEISLQMVEKLTLHLYQRVEVVNSLLNAV